MTQRNHTSTFFLATASDPKVIRRAILNAVIVGPILIAINHGDAILAGDVSLGRVAKMGLTFRVPYLVSTFSSVAALRDGGRARGTGHA